MLLAGIKVLELGQILAAPYAAEILADMGADVLKVERPDGGDDARGWGPPFWNGDAALFHQMNRNKRSVALDMKSPDGLACMLALMAEADVFIHNLRPGVPEKLGIGAQAMRARFPRLIYADIGAFGHLGPMNRQPGYELLVQAFGGPMSITGESGGTPVRCGPSINDLGSGMWTAIGVLGALLRRARTGEGCLVQTSLFETAVCWTSIAASNFLASGTPPRREGSKHPSVVPYGAFETADGPLIIGAGSDRLFRTLSDVLGHPEWATDPRFLNNSDRVLNRGALEALVTERLRTRPRAAWAEMLQAAGVPCASIQTIPEVLSHEQTGALGMVQAVTGTSGVQLIAMPLSFDGERPQARLPSPALGGAVGFATD
ncbi:CaiB/BaiF CoA-transferase family protein [Reyranella sp. CPCC 100927]|uniref:CaiB/BaiF CoA transferase family protein n=1 Tax=Reyranella sp. CPCC 100927 TaxID=2599616 RepID=UPI0011B6D503|nr:CoA transferase [Reyranella sp. CPCC 100927]TWT09962.1 CoA transferase [Reyranella sp. CPCC 100927]